MGLLYKFAVTHPYQSQTLYPLALKFNIILVEIAAVNIVKKERIAPINAIYFYPLEPFDSLAPRLQKW